jgi:hypothetical protein
MSTSGELKAAKTPAVEDDGKKKYPLSKIADPPITEAEAQAATMAVCRRHNGLVRVWGAKDGAVFSVGAASSTGAGERQISGFGGVSRCHGAASSSAVVGRIHQVFWRPLMVLRRGRAVARRVKSCTQWDLRSPA